MIKAVKNIDDEVHDRVFTTQEIIKHITHQLEGKNPAYDMNHRFMHNIESTAYSLFKDGKPIQAIILLRSIFPFGLIEAKTYLETLHKEYLNSIDNKNDEDLD